MVVPMLSEPKNLASGFGPSGGKPVYVAIAAHLERLILAKHLVHGERLPTTSEMAKLFKVTVPTAQQGLALLMDRGLLRRAPRVGTFVNANPISRTVGIAFGQNPFKIESPFPRLLLDQFDVVGHAEGINIDCHFSLGGQAFESQSRRLKEDVKNGQYACLIPIAASEELMAWLGAQKNVPWLRPAGLDIQAIAHDGMAYLLDRGFRKIVFVSMFPPKYYPDAQIGHEYQGVWSAFAERGLPLPENAVRHWGDEAKDGHDRIIKLMADRKSRPEAIFVNHDVIMKGVIQGLEEQQLRVPDDIAILSHSNRGDEIPCRIPLTRFELDPAEVARETLRFAKEKFLAASNDGASAMKAEAEMVRARLVTGASCGEAGARGAVRRVKPKRAGGKGGDADWNFRKSEVLK